MGRYMSQRTVGDVGMGTHVQECRQASRRGGKTLERVLLRLDDAWGDGSHDCGWVESGYLARVWVLITGKRRGKRRGVEQCREEESRCK